MIFGKVCYIWYGVFGIWPGVLEICCIRHLGSCDLYLIIKKVNLVCLFNCFLFHKFVCFISLFVLVTAWRDRLNHKQHLQ